MPAPAAHPTAVARLLPLLFGTLFMLLLSIAAARHPFGTYGTETDFYHLYAPDAARLAEGSGPLNTYQGPGYPLVLMIVAKIAGDLFVAAKWLSVLSGGLVVALTARIFSRIFGLLPGLGAALLFAASPQFPRYAIQATTDVFFLALSLAILDLLTTRTGDVRLRVAAAGFLSGFAYLTRYNAVSLIGAVLFAMLFVDLFERPRAARLRLVAIYGIALAVTILPWLIWNSGAHGSPLANSNHLNVATAAYPELTGGRADQDATRALAPRFHSMREVIAHDPQRFATQYVANLAASFQYGARALFNLPVAIVAFVGFMLAPRLRRSPALELVLLAAGAHLLLMALSHWETRYYFFVGVVLAGLAAWAPYAVSIIARDRIPPRITIGVATAIVLAMFWSAGRIAVLEMRRFQGSHPTEIIGACMHLQRANAHNVRIAARKPHLSYICSQQWVFLPPVESIDGLAHWARANAIEYVAIGAPEVAARPALTPLLDPRNAPAPLRPVWGSRERPFVLYRVGF